jgi:hypothetical protein
MKYLASGEAETELQFGEQMWKGQSNVRDKLVC